MYDLEEWTSVGEMFMFPCLEELTINSCYKLRDFPDSLHTCVSLQKFIVDNCPKLRSLPGVPSIIRCGIEDPPSGLHCVEYLENGDCCLPSSSTSSIQHSHPSFLKLKGTNMVWVSPGPNSILWAIFLLFNICTLCIARTWCICPPRKPCDASPNWKHWSFMNAPNLKTISGSRLSTFHGLKSMLCKFTHTIY